MNPNNWPPLRLEPQKVIVMRKAKKLMLVFGAALTISGCIVPLEQSYAAKDVRLPDSPAKKVEFDCGLKQDPVFQKSLGYSTPYCMATADLDNNTKTIEYIVINPGAGGSGGDPMAIFQRDGTKWTRLDNADQFAFFDGIAIRSTTGWSNIITNYETGNAENALVFNQGRYQRIISPK